MPAVPESWKTGSIKGLLAVGNIRVDLSWKDGKPERISLFSENSQNVEIVYKGNGLEDLLN